MTSKEVEMSDQDLADFVDRYHGALDMFFGGNPEPAKRLYSHEDDASLGNPFGPFVVGWADVEATMERAAANYSAGQATGFETVMLHVTAELAYLVEVERFEAKMVGQERIAAGALRVTSVLRPEDGEWRLVHRHADPITTPRAADSVIDQS
jgi:ketosteroid isomerase-like protein